MAVPATIGGEFPATLATGKPGRRPETKTRKPGDVPSDGIAYSRDGGFQQDSYDRSGESWSTQPLEVIAVYGHRNLFEFCLSTRLIYAFVNLANVKKGRAADDTLNSGNKNQMMIYGIVTRVFLYTDDYTDYGSRSELFHVDGGVENTHLGWIPQGRLNEDITAGARIELDAQLFNAASDLNLIGTETTEHTAWGIRIQ